MKGGSRILNRWLNRLFKLVAVFLVLFAVLLSSARLLLPYADNYRVELQDYINQRFNADIEIGGLSVGWSGTGPTMVAQNVSLIDISGLQIDVANFGFELDFWASVLNQKLVSSQFDIRGLNATLNPELFERSKSNASVVEVIETAADIFLSQIPHVTLRDSRLNVIDGESQRSLTIAKLRWQNIGLKHLGEGEIIVDGVSSNNLKLQLAFTGDELDELSGMAYVEANNIDVTPWLQQVLSVSNNKVDSQINFQVWQTISNGMPNLLQLEFGKSNFVWQSGDEAQTLSINQGQIVGHYNQSRKQFDLASNNIIWQTNETQHAPLAFYLEAQNDTLFSYISSLDVAGVNTVASVLVQTPESQAMLKKLSPQGQLNDVFIRYDEQLKLVAELTDFSNAHASGIPATTSLYASIAHQGQQTAITLSGSDGYFDFDNGFYRPIPYQAISSNIQIEQSDNGIAVAVKQLKLLSQELTLDGELTLDFPNNDAPSMALVANARDIDAANARYYYPLKSMTENLVGYLENSIISGQIPLATVIYHGKFADFPFNNNQGIFSVQADLQQASFQFDQNWPAIENLDAHLDFTNNSMTITTRGGDLSGLSVDRVIARIDELKGENVLVVDAPIEQQSPADIHRLLSQSPLEQSVAKVLDQVKISQPVSGHFNLNLPLKDTQAVVASGQVQFNDNLIELAAPEMNFHQVNGQLSFSNDKITVEDLTLLWRDKPMQLVAQGEKQDNFYQTLIDIHAKWPQATWQSEIPAKFSPYLAGELTWQGQLKLFNVDGGNFNYQLTAASDLAGSQLNFPEPYSLTAEQTADLSIVAKGDNNSSTIDALLGENLSFYGVLAHESASFNRAHLVLGEEKMMLPTDGFHITMKLDNAMFTQWHPFVRDIIESVDKVKSENTDKQTPLLEKPERIRGTIASLDLWGHQLTDISFNIFDKTHWWLLQLNAKEGRSQVKFYPDWYEQGVDVNIDFLNLPVQQGVVEEVEDVIAQSGQFHLEQAEGLLHQEKDIFDGMPPMKVHCDSCRFGLLDLGVIDFEIARSSGEIIALKNFSASRDGLAVKFDGQWLLQGDYSSTQIVGTLNVKDVESELGRLEVASAIKDSGMKTRYELNWLGSPPSFDLANLNGQVSVAFDDGYVADVSEKGAKLFSLLSLQSLVRKLTLDFRDIFADGMFYSSIKGDLTVEQGVVYTDNIKMKGSAGDLAVKGNTNLVEQELDYEMLYKPNLTSSLPALAWIATLNPVTFLAGIAIDEVITSTVVQEFKFVLSGTIDEPNLVQVDRKNTNISVGRSTPPQIVEQLPQEPDTTKPQQPPLPGKVTPLKKESVDFPEQKEKKDNIQGAING
ncbi:TIGR02099 family protein [Thalassotalea sp. LPB0316]|uniref:YhdP family protein n=1 Tax=Thalassotalea sp. LPB0316 TaxID=2769490 RepID=UPI0018675090|nr:YhdP family protein [Thalassotalea sp. LPB0316]QOL26761.1 TIGR02099 family protein [Thalassotalea sp. LPB0316]